MENQPNFLQSQPPQLIPPHKSWSHWLVVVVAILSVAGYFVASYSLALWPFEKAVGPIVMDMPTPRPSVAPDPFAGWKTYTNTEYGFEFKYPGDWEISQSLIDLRFQELGKYEKDIRYIPLVISTSENKYIDYVKNYEGIGSGFNWIGYDGDLINIFVNPDLNLDEIVENQEDKARGFWFESIEEISINNQPAKKAISRQEWEGTDKDEVVAIQFPNSTKRGITLEIDYNNGNNHKLIFDQILSTFRFIELSVYNYELRESWGSGTETWWDAKLVQINKTVGEEKILVDSIKNAVPELKKEFNLIFQKLSFPDGNRLYFKEILDGTDAPSGGIWVYEINLNKFTKLKSSVYYQWFAPKQLSPDGKLIASIDSPDKTYNKLFLINLENDSIRTLITLTGQQSFNGCFQDCFGGVFGELKWIDGKTIEYSIYDTTQIEEQNAENYTLRNYKLIGKRRISI